MEYLITIALIISSAGFSGLTLAYFSLNKQNLQRKARLGDPLAQKILTVRQDGNRLLTTLLLGNVAVNAILSVYLSSLASGVAAAFMATSLILVFGEIIPQATFARHAMLVGAKAASLIKVLMILSWPLTTPVVFCLHKLLGAEMPTIYSRQELMAIVSELENSEQKIIDADEERIIHGALQFSHTTVREVMTDKDDVVSFDENQRLNRNLIVQLQEHGYSRYPIYSGNPDNIVGILFAKDLIGETPDTPLKHTEEAMDRNILLVKPETKLDTLLAVMLKRRQHLGIVQTKNGQFLGVIALEDIIEEIIQIEIEDEADQVS